MVLQRFRLPAGLMVVLAVLLSTLPSTTTSAFASGVKTVVAAPKLLGDGTALIMGGTGMPDPPQWYLDKVNDIYVSSNFPGYEPVALHTPAEAWPIFGWLTGDQSVAMGVKDLHNAITGTYKGDDLLIFGVSQSALIASREMQSLAINRPAGLGDLHFALLGGPDNPMGGIFERFSGLEIPGVHFGYYPPTPTNLFDTDIYTGQYDGVSDFPRYPLNILSVINAFAGMQYVHLNYGNLTADQIESATHLGHTGMTDFYMIPTNILPLLQPLYDSSDAGKLMVDYLQPMLKVLVDLGYGNLQHGIVADPGGVDGAGLIGFLPKMDPLAVTAALQLGQIEGSVNVTNSLLQYIGLGPMPDYVTDILKATSGYDLTVWLDQMMVSGLNQLSALPGMAVLDPDFLFDGQPLIDGTPLVDALNDWINQSWGWLG